MEFPSFNLSSSRSSGSDDEIVFAVSQGSDVENNEVIEVIEDIASDVFGNQQIVSVDRRGPAMRERVSEAGISPEEEIQEAYNSLLSLLHAIHPELLRSLSDPLRQVEAALNVLPVPGLNTVVTYLLGFIDVVLTYEKDGHIVLKREDLRHLVEGLSDDIVLSINALTSMAIQFVPENLKGVLAPLVQIVILLNKLRCAGVFIPEEEGGDKTIFVPEQVGESWAAPQDLLEIVTLPQARSPSSGSTRSYGEWLECFSRLFLDESLAPEKDSAALKSAQSAIGALLGDEEEFEEFCEALPQGVPDPHEDTEIQEKVSERVASLQSKVYGLQAGQCLWMTLSDAGISPLILRIRKEEDGKFTLTLFSVGDELGRLGDAHGLLSLHDKGAIDAKAVQLNFFERQGVSLEKLCGSHFLRELVWQRCFPNTILQLANTDELSTRKGLFENYLDGQNAPLPSMKDDHQLFYQKSRSQGESMVGALLGKTSSFDLLKTIVRHLYLETAQKNGDSLQEAQKSYRRLRFEWTRKVLVGALQPKRQRVDGTFTTRGALAHRLLHLASGASRRDIQLVKKILRAVRKQAWRVAQDMANEEEGKNFLKEVQRTLQPAEEFLRAKTQEVLQKGSSLVTAGLFDIPLRETISWEIPVAPSRPNASVQNASVQADSEKEKTSLRALRLTQGLLEGKNLEGEPAPNELEVVSLEVRQQLVAVAENYATFPNSRQDPTYRKAAKEALSPNAVLRHLVGSLEHAQPEERSPIIAAFLRLLSVDKEAANTFVLAVFITRIAPEELEESQQEVLLDVFRSSLKQESSKWSEDGIGATFALGTCYKIAQSKMQDLFVEEIFYVIGRLPDPGVLKAFNLQEEEILHVCKLLTFLEKKGKQVDEKVFKALTKPFEDLVNSIKEKSDIDRLYNELLLLTPLEAAPLGPKVREFFGKVKSPYLGTSELRRGFIKHVIAKNIETSPGLIEQQWTNAKAWDDLSFKEGRTLAYELLEAQRLAKDENTSRIWLISLDVLITRLKKDFPDQFETEAREVLCGTIKVLDPPFFKRNLGFWSAYKVCQNLDLPIECLIQKIFHVGSYRILDLALQEQIFAGCLEGLLAASHLSVETKNTLLLELIERAKGFKGRLPSAVVSALRNQAVKIIALATQGEPQQVVDRLFTLLPYLVDDIIGEKTLPEAFWVAVPTPTGEGTSLWEQIDDKAAERLAKVLICLLQQTVIQKNKDGYIALMNAMAILEVLLKKCETLKLEKFRFDYSPLVYGLIKEPTRYNKNPDWPLPSCEGHDKFQELLQYFLRKEDYDLEHHKMSTYRGQRHVKEQSGPAGLRKTGRLEGKEAYKNPDRPGVVDYLKSYFLRYPLPDMKANLTYYAAQFIYGPQTPEFQEYYQGAQKDLAIENYRRARLTLFHKTIPLNKVSARLEKLKNYVRTGSSEEKFNRLRDELQQLIDEIVSKIDDNKILQTFHQQMQEWKPYLSENEQQAEDDKVLQELQNTWKKRLNDIKETIASIDWDFCRQQKVAPLRSHIVDIGDFKELLGNGVPIEPLAPAEELFWKIAEKLGESLTQNSVNSFLHQWRQEWRQKTDDKPGTRKGYLLPTIPASLHFPTTPELRDLSTVSSLLVQVDGGYSSAGIFQQITGAISSFFGADIEERDTPYPSSRRIASIEELGHFRGGSITSDSLFEGDFSRMEAAVFSDQEGGAALLLHNFLSRWLLELDDRRAPKEKKMKERAQWVFSPVIFDQLSADMELIRQFTLLLQRGIAHYLEKNERAMCLAFVAFSNNLEKIYRYRQEHPHRNQRPAQEDIRFLNEAAIRKRLDNAEGDLEAVCEPVACKELQDRLIGKKRCRMLPHELANLPPIFSMLLPTHTKNIQVWIPVGEKAPSVAYVEIPGSSQTAPQYYAYDSQKKTITKMPSGEVLSGSYPYGSLGQVLVWSVEDDSDIIVIGAPEKRSYHFKDYGMVFEQDNKGDFSPRAFPSYKVEKDPLFEDSDLLEGVGAGYVVISNAHGDRKVLLFDKVEGRGETYVYEIKRKDLPSYATEQQGRSLLVPASVDSALYAARLCVKKGHYGRAARYLRRQGHTVSPYTQRQRELLLALWQEGHNRQEAAAQAIALRAIYMLEDNRLSYDPAKRCDIDWEAFDKTYQQYTLLASSLRAPLTLGKEERRYLLQRRYVSALHGEGRQPGLLGKLSQLGKVGASVVNESMLDAEGFLHQEDKKDDAEGQSKVSSLSGMPISMQQELQRLLKKVPEPYLQEQKLTRLCEVLPVMAFEKGDKTIDMQNLVEGYERRLHAKVPLDFTTLPPALHISAKTFIEYFGQFYYIAKRGTPKEKQELQEYLDIMSGNMSLVVHGVTDVDSEEGFTLYYWLAHKVLAAPDLYLDIDADYRRKMACQDRLLELREEVKCWPNDLEPGETIDGIEVFFNYYDTVRLGDAADVKALKARMQAQSEELAKAQKELQDLEAAIKRWDYWKKTKPEDTPWPFDNVVGALVGSCTERLKEIQDDYDNWKKDRPDKKISVLDRLRVHKLEVQIRKLEIETSAYKALEELLKVQDRRYTLPHLDEVDRDALRRGVRLDEARAIDLAWSVCGFDVRHLWRLRKMGFALAQAGVQAIFGPKDDIKLREYYAEHAIDLPQAPAETVPLPLPMEEVLSFQKLLQQRIDNKIFNTSLLIPDSFDPDIQEIIEIQEVQDGSVGLLSLFEEQELLLEGANSSLADVIHEGDFVNENSKAKFREIEQSLARYRRPQAKTYRLKGGAVSIGSKQERIMEEVQGCLHDAHDLRKKVLFVARGITARNVESDFRSHLDSGKVSWEQLTQASLQGDYDAYSVYLPGASEDEIASIDNDILQHDAYCLQARLLMQVEEALGKAYEAWKGAGEEDPEYLEYLAQARKAALSIQSRGSLAEALPELEGFSPQEIDKIRRVLLRFEAREGKVLRPKQLRILGKALSALKRGDTTVILEAGTGTGKSKVLEILFGMLGPQAMKELPHAIFGVYTWPSSLAATNKNDMHSQAMDVFDVQAEALHFAYRYFTKDHEGVIYTLYEKFIRAVQEKRLINSKPEDWQSLELAVLEKLADKDARKEIPHLIHMGLEMLRVLRSYGLQLPDETQITCGPKRLVKHRLGEQTSLEEHHLDILYVLHEAMVERSCKGGDFDWATGRGTVLFNDYERQVDDFEKQNPETYGFPDSPGGHFLKAVAEDALGRLIHLWNHGASHWGGLLSEQREEVLAYLSDKRCPPPADWDDERRWPQKLRVALDGLRGQLTFLLPKTLSSSYHSEFGESPDPNKPYMVFWDKGTPQKDPSVELDLVLEASNQTLRGWLVKGLTDDLITRLVTLLVEQAQAEKKRRQDKIALQDTRAGQLFYKAIDGCYEAGMAPSLTSFKKISKDTHPKVFEVLRRDPSMILYAVSYLILPEIPVYERKIESNSANLLSQFKGQLGGSATPGHRLQYGLDTFFIPDEDEVLGEIVDFTDSMLAKGNIRGYRPGKAQEILEQIMALVRTNGQGQGALPLRELVDLTGILNGITPQEFAEAVQKLYQDHQEVAGLLLFAKSEGGQEERLVMHHLQEERQEPVEQSRLSPTRYFVYINQGGSVGTDTKMHPVSCGLLTIDSKTTLQDAGQAEGRQRNKGLGQEALFLFPIKELALLLEKDEDDAELVEIAQYGLSASYHQELLEKLRRKALIQWIQNQVLYEEEINEAAFGFLLLNEVRSQMVENILHAEGLEQQGSLAERYYDFLVTLDSLDFSKLWGGVRKNLPMQLCLLAMVEETEALAKQYFKGADCQKVLERLERYRQVLPSLFPQEDELVEEGDATTPFLLKERREVTTKVSAVGTSVSVQANVATNVDVAVDVQNNVNNNMQVHAERPHTLPLHRHHSSLWNEDLDLFGTPWYAPEGTFHLRAAVVSKAVRTADVAKSLAFGKPGEFIAAMSEAVHRLPSWKKIVVFSLVSSTLLTLLSLGIGLGLNYGALKLGQSIKAAAQKALATFRQTRAYAWMQQHPFQSALVGISSLVLVAAGGYKIHQCRTSWKAKKAKNRGVGVYLMDAVDPNPGKLFGDKILVTNNYLAVKPNHFFEPIEELHSRENTPLVYTILVAIKQKDPEHPYDFRYIVAGQADAECFREMLKRQIPPPGCPVSIAVRLFDSGRFEAQSENWPQELSIEGIKANKDFAVLDDLVRFGVAGRVSGYSEAGILGLQGRIASLAHNDFNKGAEVACKSFNATTRFKPGAQKNFKGSEVHEILSYDRRNPSQANLPPKVSGHRKSGKKVRIKKDSKAEKV